VKAGRQHAAQLAVISIAPGLECRSQDLAQQHGKDRNPCRSRKTYRFSQSKLNGENFAEGDLRLAWAERRGEEGGADM